MIELKEELKTLAASRATEDELNDKIQDYQIKKAEADVKLFVTDETLQQAQQKVAMAENQERKLRERLAGLESEARVLRSEREETLIITTRLAEIEAQNQVSSPVSFCRHHHIHRSNKCPKWHSFKGILLMQETSGHER